MKKYIFIAYFFILLLAAIPIIRKFAESRDVNNIVKASNTQQALIPSQIPSTNVQPKTLNVFDGNGNVRLDSSLRFDCHLDWMLRFIRISKFHGCSKNQRNWSKKSPWGFSRADFVVVWQRIYLFNLNRFHHCRSCCLLAACQEISLTLLREHSGAESRCHVTSPSVTMTGSPASCAMRE